MIKITKTKKIEKKLLGECVKCESPFKLNVSIEGSKKLVADHRATYMKGKFDGITEASETFATKTDVVILTKKLDSIEVQLRKLNGEQSITE